MTLRFSLDNAGDPGFLQAVGMGRYDNIKARHTTGLNTNVGTSYTTLWEENGLYVYRDTAIVMSVSSDDANDTSAGTGARTVKITGLDTNFDEMNETITLNGLTEVTTSNSFMRIINMQVETAGSGIENAGNIYMGTGTVTLGKPSVVHGLITLGYNKSLLGMRTIPNNHQGFLILYELYSGIAKQISARVVVKPPGGVFQTQDLILLREGKADHIYLAPFPLLEKSDIEIQAKTAVGSGDIAVHFLIILMKKT